MEASRPAGVEVAMNFDFALLFDAERLEDARPISYASIVEDIRPTLSELRRALIASLEERKQPLPVEIVELEVREGSVVFEIVARLYDVGTAIAAFGGLMQGLEYLARIFRPTVEAFLRRFMPGPFMLQQVIVLPRPPAATIAPAPFRPARRDLLQSYLIASHGALLLFLGAVIVVLLARGG
jgi:hypothetical protein